METNKRELLNKVNELNNLISKIELNPSIEKSKEEIDLLYSLIPNVKKGDYVICKKKSKLQKLTIDKKYLVIKTWDWSVPHRTCVMIKNDSGNSLSIYQFKVRVINKEWEIPSMDNNILNHKKLNIFY